MPKYRKLPITVLDSLDMTEMPDDFTRLTWLLLPLVVCRDGRAFDMAQWLVSKLYPARTDVDAAMVAQAMEWFASRGMIQRYNVNGRHYFYLTNWQKHQGDTGREAESPYPAPPEEMVAKPVRTNSRATQELVKSKSRPIQSNSNSNSNSNATAAAIARGHPDASATQESAAAAVHSRLKAIGLGTNARTLALLDLPHFDDQYAADMVAWAERAGRDPGLAIKKIEDGDPVPRKRSASRIPSEYEDIIQR